MAKGKVVEEVKEKVEEVKEKIQDKKNAKLKPLVTCRVLFISVLDKIYLIALALEFIILTWNNFSGSMSSMSYGYWHRVLGEIGILICMAIAYFICNWFYKCAAKTMLCVTENQIYKEHYVPFKRREISIPLNKVTSISTFNVFWIFRSVIIFQYHHIPMVFFTWNNKEFKDKVNELINHETKEVENEFEDKNILSFVDNKFIIIFFIVLGAIILFLGIVRFFGYTFSPAKKVPGTYVNKNDQIVLNKEGTCEIEPIHDDVVSCTWEYNEEAKEVDVTYEYEYTSCWSSTKTKYSNTAVLKQEDDKLIYSGTEYTRK